MKLIITIAVACASLIGIATDKITHASPLLGADGGYVGRIKLASHLDEPRGYCLDVPGPAGNLLFHIPVWAHTCHASPQPDQIFRYNEEGSGLLRFVFEEHDLCLTAVERREGSRFSYLPCTAPDRQAFDVDENGSFSLRDSELCLVVANMEDGGSQNEIGTGREVRATHRVRGLRLRQCEKGSLEMARWEAMQP
jgi:hypothetical protein